MKTDDNLKKYIDNVREVSRNFMFHHLNRHYELNKELIWHRVGICIAIFLSLAAFVWGK